MMLKKAFQKKTWVLRFFFVRLNSTPFHVGNDRPIQNRMTADRLFLGKKIHSCPLELEVSAAKKQGDGKETFFCSRGIGVKMHLLNWMDLVSTSSFLPLRLLRKRGTYRLPDIVYRVLVRCSNGKVRYVKKRRNFLIIKFVMQMTGRRKENFRTL